MSRQNESRQNSISGEKKQILIAVGGPVISRIREFTEALESGFPENESVILSMRDFFVPPEKKENTEKTENPGKENHSAENPETEAEEAYPCFCRPELFTLSTFLEVLDTMEQPFVFIEGELALYFDEITERTQISIFLQEDEQFLFLSSISEREKQGKKSTREDIDHFYSRSMPEVRDYILPTEKKADIIIAPDENPHEAAPAIIRYIQRTFDARYGRRKEGEAYRKQLESMILRYEKSDGGKIRLKKFIFRLVAHSARIFKRFTDIVGSFAALILLSPLFLATAAAIKATDGGPVIYTQTRIGKHGKEFKFPKFRSMVRNADKLKDQLLKQSIREGDVTFKMKDDPRITPVGRFIRKFSIDELPQLWCVLKGDMSLVGPRPPVPREVALYSQEDRRRLEVTPGLTGIWQVSGRADIGFEDQVKLDVQYIESHSVRLDIKLLLKTIPAVFMGKGAY